VCPFHRGPVIWRDTPGIGGCGTTETAFCERGHQVPRWGVLHVESKRIVAGGSVEEAVVAFKFEDFLSKRRVAVPRGPLDSVGAA
jgi:hypothetical protein